MNKDAAIFYALRLQTMCKDTKCDDCPFHEYAEGVISYRICHIGFPKESWGEIKEDAYDQQS